MSLYNPNDSRDNCGFGLIAHTTGEASHTLVTTAIEGLDRMQHRGGIAADGKTGDGCGLLLQKPDAFFQHVAEQHGWRVQPADESRETRDRNPLPCRTPETRPAARG